MKTEIEDYPKDFEIQIRLSESLHEQNRLRRELETLKEQGIVEFIFFYLFV